MSSDPFKQLKTDFLSAANNRSLSTGTILDLSSKAVRMAATPKSNLDDAIMKKREELIKIVQSRDLYDRITDYQVSITWLASYLEIIKGIPSSFGDSGPHFKTWIELVKRNIDWVEVSITDLERVVYHMLGNTYDTLIQKIRLILSLCDEKLEKNTDAQFTFVTQMRELMICIIELANTLISGLFDWLNQIRQIALEKVFKLGNITIAVSPIIYTPYTTPPNVVTFFKILSIPIPILQPPSITIAFSQPTEAHKEDAEDG